MNKSLCFSIGFILFLSSLFTLPIYGKAEGNEESQSSSSLQLLKTETHVVGNESFELEIWIDNNGEEIYSVSQEVEDKQAVADYVDKLVEERTPGSMTTMGTKINWSNSLQNVDKQGKVNWNVGGYSQYGTFAGINPDVIRVNDGTLKATFTGSGNADKLLVYTKYTFNGATISIAKSPALSGTSRTVEWKSLPVNGKWYLNTKSLWAEGRSRVLISSVEINAGAEIYKGSNIYRPNIYHKIPFGSKK